MTADARRPGLVFGEVADDYDRVRLPYPEMLIDNVLAYLGPAETPPRALEVGAGTGKATVAFARRGVPVVAVEPDPAMAEVLARNVAELPVQVVRSSFEEYATPPDEPFDLVYAADSWHWADPARRWEAAAGALGGSGVLALFWNHDRIGDPGQQQILADTVAKHAESAVVPSNAIEEKDIFGQWPGNEMLQRGEFTETVGRIYRSRRVVTRTDFLTFMSTRSQIRLLEPEVRQGLFDALDGSLDETLPIDVATVLYLARRRGR
jgi:SAM-dependent methyltransferase